MGSDGSAPSRPREGAGRADTSEEARTLARTPAPGMPSHAIDPVDVPIGGVIGPRMMTCVVCARPKRHARQTAPRWERGRAPTLPPAWHARLLRLLLKWRWLPPAQAEGWRHRPLLLRLLLPLSHSRSGERELCLLLLLLLLLVTAVASMVA